jgi:hypothetical protein
MTQSTFTAGSAVPQGQGGWTLAKALAPLLRPWREPRPLYPEELSDHWRRDLGLPESGGRDGEGGLGAWTRLGRW